MLRTIRKWLWVRRLRRQLRAARALAAVGIALLFACDRDPRPTRWLGMDRARVACAWADDVYRRVRCAGEGRLYECVSDDGHEWQCAPVGTERPTAERAP